MTSFLFNIIRDSFTGCRKPDWWFSYPKPPSPYWKNGERVRLS